MIKLSTSINNMLLNRKTENSFIIGKMQADWKNVVGDQISKATYPTKIEKQKLYIKCKNSTWKTELIYQKNEIIKKINKNQSITIKEIILL